MASIPRTIFAWDALPPVEVNCTSLKSFRAALSDTRDHFGVRPRVSDALTFQMPHHCH